MIGFAIFGVAVAGVLFLVVRLGRAAGSAVSAPPPGAGQRFGSSVPASDPAAYAVSAVMPAGVGAGPLPPPPALSFPPPSQSYPPPAQSFPPPAESFPPPAESFPRPAESFPPATGFAPPVPGGSFPPPAPPLPSGVYEPAKAWGTPYAGSPFADSQPVARKPFKVLAAVIGVFMLIGIGTGAYRFLRNELNPLEQPAELGGLPLANDMPMLAPMINELRSTVEDDGTRNALVAAYTAPGQPLYVVAGGRNQAYESRQDVLKDFRAGIADDPSARIGSPQRMTTPQGHPIDCLSVSSEEVTMTSCLWKHADTAGVVMAFGVEDFEVVASVTGEAMQKSGAA